MGTRAARPRVLRFAALALPTLMVIGVWVARAAAQPADAGIADAAPETADAAPLDSARDPGPAPDAGSDGTGGKAPAPKAAPEPADVLALQARTAEVRAYLAGTLAPNVVVAQLFDVPLDDERAIAVEAARLRKVVSQASQPRAPEETPEGDAGSGGSPSSPPEPQDDPAGLDRKLFEARLELDRARLAFYELSPERRRELFESHEAARAAQADARTNKELSEAEAAQQQAAVEKEQALDQARRARSQAEKLVNEELAALYDIQGRYAKLDEQLIKADQQLETFDERLLSWTLPADEILHAAPSERPAVEAIDRVYDELALQLAETRTALDAALADVEDTLPIPPVGQSSLAALPVKIDTSRVDALRATLLDKEQQLRGRAESLRWRRSRQQMEALEALGQRRLALIPLLSKDKRSQLRSLDGAAFEQAANELAQVTLLFRYHLLATRRFVDQVRETGEAGDSTLIAVVTALKWLLPIGLFVWWRRRADETLDAWNEAAQEAGTKRAIPRGFSRGERSVSFVRRIRRPLEWLLLTWAVLYLLPSGAAELLEVQLLSTILSWTLGGWLVVTVIDALLSDDGGSRRTALQTSHLRWRTLRLLGRVVVTLGLFLALAQQLVGKGTIYSWAVWIASLSGLFVGLLVVRWWRPVIFHHVGVQRKKGPLLRWVSRTERGWGSFAAAIVGGGYLLVQGTTKVLRHHLGGIDVVKRLLAYWFRREVTRQAEKAGLSEDEKRLETPIYRALDPERAAPELVTSVADDQVEDVIARIHQPGGGVFALVGERGAGKSTLIRRIAERSPEAKVLTCPASGTDAFSAALRRALGVAEETSADDLRTLLRKWPKDSALLVDDAHHLVRPVVDGLKDIDELLALARSSSTSCTWVFAFDAVIWQFFARAREVRPLFDDIVKLTPWSEEGIVRLLASRSEAAGIEPDFSALVTELPEDADEIDLEEALGRAQRGYYRLLWDYSLGNPAVSLHFWRASLRRGGEGHHLVRLFDAPQTADLERLPDSTVFVLRAVVQLDFASVDDIIEATMLPRNQVEDALRYAMGRRYLEILGGRYRVRWTWFRTLTRFLARRHLLMGPYQ